MLHNPLAKQSTLYLLTALVSVCFQAHAQNPMPEAAEEHKALLEEVGTWDAETKTWMTPDAEPIVGKGTETNTALGNMWILSEYQGKMMGMTYKGQGQFGYDPVKKKYVGTWIDNISPHLSTMEGTGDEATKTLTLYSTGIDFMTGKETTRKMVSTLVDHDHKKFVIYSPVEGKEGQWWKMMEFNYTRKK